ncbi:MAG: hypothetical protein R6X18_12780 [Chloroflexota bacterium]
MGPKPERLFVVAAVQLDKGVGLVAAVIVDTDQVGQAVAVDIPAGDDLAAIQTEPAVFGPASPAE